MPFSRACPVRAGREALHKARKEEWGLNALFAGVPCAGARGAKDATPTSTSTSQCPFRGRALCGGSYGAPCNGDSDCSVSMPFSRACPVRVITREAYHTMPDTSLSQCPFRGRALCGCSSTASCASWTRRCLNALFAGVPCAGHEADRQRAERHRRVSMPFSRACPVRASTREGAAPGERRRVSMPFSRACPVRAGIGYCTP